MTHLARSPSFLLMVQGNGPFCVIAIRVSTMQPEDIEREWISSARALLVDGYHTTAAISAATWARETGIPVIADLDVLRPGIDDLMPLVDYAFASREFPGALTGEPDLKKALAMLHEQFHCRLAGITLGVGAC